MAKEINTTAWTFYGAIDLHTFPGCFMGKESREFEPLPGIKVQAFNWLHAEYLAAKHIMGGELKCEHCGAPLSAVACIFVDAAGNYHGVGRDCAKFIEAKIPRDAFEQLELIRSMKQITTKQGPRVVLSFQAPIWFWAVPKETRPKFISLKPWQGKRETKWFVTIWGSSETEVLDNYAAFKALKPKP
jgi:hypothetical protein